MTMHITFTVTGAMPTDVEELLVLADKAATMAQNIAAFKCMIDDAVWGAMARRMANQARANDPTDSPPEPQR